jgi:hypothetical protein
MTGGIYVKLCIGEIAKFCDQLHLLLLLLLTAIELSLGGWYRTLHTSQDLADLGVDVEDNIKMDLQEVG